jgi:hypothetical protein
LGVSPDGSLVVFEVTDEIRFGVLGPLVFPFNALPAEQKGIFAVAADGTGLRRLGPASRVASYWQSFFLFSPSGRLVAYTDEGPGPDDAVGVAAGSAAVQIFTLDVETGDRTQVTRLPPGTGPFGGTYQPFFNDEHTITFSTKADLDGSNPSHKNLIVTVKTDGTGLTVAPPVVALPGAEVLTSFRIAGADLAAAGLNVDIPAENPVPGYEMSHEVFAIDRDDNILQLTTFGRYDTWHPMVSADGERVLFSASADPLGTNPTNNCQIFSIHPTGADLRQLTHFQEVPDGLHAIGCSFGPLPLGCGAYFLGRDLQTDTVLFNSWCDPFGTNPNGNQLFAMRADGTGLRQLTTARGYTQDASGVLTVEAPFPFAWPGLRTWEQIP